MKQEVLTCVLLLTCAAARLGLADEARTMVSQNASRIASGYRFPAMWGPNFDWIPDQCHGSVMMMALQRMVLQCDPPTGKLLLLPAWPKHWNVDFRLHAPDRTVVEGRYRRGRLESWSITPLERKRDVAIIIGEST